MKYRQATNPEQNSKQVTASVAAAVTARSTTGVESIDNLEEVAFTIEFEFAGVLMVLLQL
jgi:hypothetical protein